MNRAELKSAAEDRIREILRQHLPSPAPVYLFGSRARNTARWNSDYDLWVDANVPREVLIEISDALDESFVPFKVDVVTTPQLRGCFGERVRAEAQRWM